MAAPSNSTSSAGTFSLPRQINRAAHPQNTDSMRLQRLRAGVAIAGPSSVPSHGPPPWHRYSVPEESSDKLKYVVPFAYAVVICPRLRSFPAQLALHPPLRRKRRPARGIQVQCARALRFGAPVNPLMPREVLQVALLAHRDKRHLRQIDLLARLQAGLAPLPPSRCQWKPPKPPAPRAKMPLRESQQRHGQASVRHILPPAAGNGCLAAVGSDPRPASPAAATHPAGTPPHRRHRRLLLARTSGWRPGRDHRCPIAYHLQGACTEWSDQLGFRRSAYLAILVPFLFRCRAS